MANFNPTIITDSGLSLIAKISSGSGQMRFTRICTSKSSYSVDEAQHLSALTTVEQETTIDKVEIINDTAVKVSAVITNKLLESGYYINAIGLYAEDPDLGEILYSITIAKVPDWMQPDSGSGVSSLLIQLITQVSNSSTVKTELNPSVLATVQDLLDHAGNADIHVTAEEKANWNGKAELSDIPATLPANGGNADTVGGYSAALLYKRYDGPTSDANLATGLGIYTVNPGCLNVPENEYGILSVESANVDVWLKQTFTRLITPHTQYVRMWNYSAWSGWEKVSDGGNADTAKSVQSATGKASLYEDGEGGNLKLVSPDGTKALEIDLYNNNGMRFILWEDGNPIIPLNYDFLTKKFSITGDISNANNLESHPSSDFYLKTDIVDSSRELVSPNAKARLWEDSEGGNLRLVSPDGHHYVEMDLCDNNSFRMYFVNEGSSLIQALTYDFTTEKLNINGNAETIDGKSSSDLAYLTNVIGGLRRGWASTDIGTIMTYGDREVVKITNDLSYFGWTINDGGWFNPVVVSQYPSGTNYEMFGNKFGYGISQDSECASFAYKGRTYYACWSSGGSYQSPTVVGGLHLTLTGNDYISACKTLIDACETIDSDTVDGKHASDFATSDDNYFLYTFSKEGDKHGAAHRLVAKHNIKNDGRFYIQDEDNHHVRVNYADGADAANTANTAGTLATTASNICLRNLSSGTAAATTDNCPSGAWYGQYEEV